MATPTELRNAVVNAFLGEVGYTSGTYTWSKYGLAKNWRSSWLGGITEWQGLYCGRSYSWPFDQVLGARAGVAAIGLQGYALPVGFAATWLHREWFRNNGRHVGFANSQPGDAFLFKLPGRPLNPTNHIGMFVKWHIPGKVAIVCEGNLPHPVTRTTASIGVHLHYRDITYVVGVYRPDWDAATAIYNTENPTEEDDMSAEQYDAIMAAINKNHEAVRNLHRAVDRVHQDMADRTNKVPAAVWGYRNPGYPQRDAHGSLRDAATAKQIAAKERVLTQAQINDTED